MTEAQVDRVGPYSRTQDAVRKSEASSWTVGTDGGDTDGADGRVARRGRVGHGLSGPMMAHGPSEPASPTIRWCKAGGRSRRIFAPSRTCSRDRRSGGLRIPTQQFEAGAAANVMSPVGDHYGNQVDLGCRCGARSSAKAPRAVAARALVHGRARCRADGDDRDREDHPLGAALMIRTPRSRGGQGWLGSGRPEFHHQALLLARVTVSMQTSNPLVPRMWSISDAVSIRLDPIRGRPRDPRHVGRAHRSSFGRCQRGVLASAISPVYSFARTH